LEESFFLITDASDHTLSGILCQLDEDGDLQPVAYESKKLPPTKYSKQIGEKELLAGLHCMHVWRCYLALRQFEWWTDHINLRTIRDKPTLTPWEVRYLNKISSYDFVIKPIAGSANPADALTRHDDDPNFKSKMQPDTLTRLRFFKMLTPLEELQELFPNPESPSRSTSAVAALCAGVNLNPEDLDPLEAYTTYPSKYLPSPHWHEGQEPYISEELRKEILSVIAPSQTPNSDSEEEVQPSAPSPSPPSAPTGLDILVVETVPPILL
jgi:hypothetical protein